MYSQRTVLLLEEGMYDDAARNREFWPMFLDSLRQIVNFKRNLRPVLS